MNATTDTSTFSATTLDMTAARARMETSRAFVKATRGLAFTAEREDGAGPVSVRATTDGDWIASWTDATEKLEQTFASWDSAYDYVRWTMDHATARVAN